MSNRKTSHRPPKVPTGHHSVTKPFQCVAVDLVQHQTLSEGHRLILSVIDLTRFVILIAIKNIQATTVVVRNLVDRVFSVFGGPETLHFDQGKEFENQLVKYNLSLGTRKPVPQRIVCNMLAMYGNLACDNWAAMLPLVQLAHNTAYIKTLEESPYCLMSVAQLTYLSNAFLVSPLRRNRKVDSIAPVVHWKTCN